MPTAGNILLDTNALIAFLANDPAFDAQFSTATILIPATALGELYYGAYKSGRVQANLDTLDRLVASSAAIHCDGATARVYGLVKYRLKAKGRMIPENDGVDRGFGAAALTSRGDARSAFHGSGSTDDPLMVIADSSRAPPAPTH
jgi:tRNA(fMet)-specific endonuclease VapC